MKITPRTLSLSLLTALSLCTISYAETPSSGEKKILWDSWYTVTLAGKTPYGYYNDHVELKDGKIGFKNQFWKKEEGFINEEQLVAFGEDKSELTPILFNFHSNYRDTVVDIDGNVKLNILSIKIRKDKEDLKPMSRNIPKNAFFSSMFPVWLGKKLNELREGKLVSFSAILEDNLDRKYAPVSGSIRLEKNDEYSKKNDAKKIAVIYQDKKSTWYVKPTGEAVKIVMHDQNAVIEKTTEALARKFLISSDGL